MFTIRHFQSLAQRFPTWSELRTHLESADGGALRIVEQEGSPNLSIVRYVKGKSDLRTPELGAGLFRSVVWDTEKNMPVCVAPVKARADLPIGVELSSTEDFVDGFMVNLFVRRDGTSQIATRTVLGATGTFYDPNVSFAAMFQDAIGTTPLRTKDALVEVLKKVCEEGNYSSVFTSFVVQHPAHRIVAKVVTPQLYCVHVGQVHSDGLVTLSDRAIHWPQQLSRFQIPSYPVRKFATEAEIEDLLKRTAAQRGWRWQGLAFKDKDGNRWRIRSPTYQALRNLRGGEAAPVDRFLRLRTAHQLGDYLKHYSEDSAQFWELENTLRERTRDVLAAYTDVHKAHAVAFKDLPESYQPPVFLAHRLWLDQLRAKGHYVRLKEVIQIVTGLRDFEQKRLVLAEPYQKVATSVPAQDAVQPTS